MVYIKEHRRAQGKTTDCHEGQQKTVFKRVHNE